MELQQGTGHEMGDDIYMRRQSTIDQVSMWETISSQHEFIKNQLEDDSLTLLQRWYYQAQLIAQKLDVSLGADGLFCFAVSYAKQVTFHLVGNMYGLDRDFGSTSPIVDEFLQFNTESQGRIIHVKCIRVGENYFLGCDFPIKLQLECVQYIREEESLDKMLKMLK